MLSAHPVPLFPLMQTVAHVMDLVYHSHLFSSSWRQSVTAASTALLSFSPHPSTLTPLDLLQVAMRVNGNAHSLVDSSGTSAVVGLGLYPRVSLLNHSCVPSCHFTARPHGALHVRPRLHLHPGDELTVHYCDLYDTREERGRQLLREKGFVCRCPRCTEDIRGSVDRLVGGVYCPCAYPPTRSLADTAVPPAEKREGSSREEVEVDMPVPPSTAALIVFVGDVSKPADDLRRDYQCLRCQKKYPLAAVSALLQPLVALHQSATQHRAGGRTREAMEGLERLVAVNRAAPVVTAYHPLLLSCYVLLYNLAMHARGYAAAVGWARRVVAAYRAVFPEGFMETGDWLYAEGLACDAAWKEWKEKGKGGGRGAERVVQRWKEERNRALAECWQIRSLCGLSPDPLSNQLQVVP